MSSNALLNGTNYQFTNPLKPNKTDSESNLVVCVHGMGFALFHFDKLTTALENKGYNVLRYDLIGCGSSLYPIDKLFDDNAHVTQLRNLLLLLRIPETTKYHLICHSMGGAIGTLYAQRFSSEILSITLLAPAGLIDLGPLKVIRQMPSLARAAVKNLIKSRLEKSWRGDFVSHTGDALDIENHCVQKMKSIHKSNPKVMDAYWRCAMQFPLTGINEAVKSLASSKVKVFLLWGTADKVVAYDPNFERWKNIFDDHNNGVSTFQYKLYDNLAHAFFLEAHKVVNKDIINFLSNI